MSTELTVESNLKKNAYIRRSQSARTAHRRRSRFNGTVTIASSKFGWVCLGGAILAEICFSARFECWITDHTVIGKRSPESVKRCPSDVQNLIHGFSPQASCTD